MDKHKKGKELKDRQVQEIKCGENKTLSPILEQYQQEGDTTFEPDAAECYGEINGSFMNGIQGIHHKVLQSADKIVEKNQEDSTEDEEIPLLSDGEIYSPPPMYPGNPKTFPDLSDLSVIKSQPPSYSQLQGNGEITVPGPLIKHELEVIKKQPEPSSCVKDIYPEKKDPDKDSLKASRSSPDSELKPEALICCLLYICLDERWCRHSTEYFQNLSKKCCCCCDCCENICDCNVCCECLAKTCPDCDCDCADCNCL